MSNEEERDGRIQKENEEKDMDRVKLELNTIRDDLMYELDDLHDDLKDVLTSAIANSVAPARPRDESSSKNVIRINRRFGGRMRWAVLTV